MKKLKKCKRYDCNKPRNPARKDGYCTARCKSKDRWDDIRDYERSRVCDPDTGWF